MADRSILDGAVQIYQVQGGQRKLVGVGFGDTAGGTDRWFVHTATAPVMMPTSAAPTTFEPLAGQNLAARWTLPTWTTASDPTQRHTAAQDTTRGHAVSPYLRHDSADFKYIKTAVASYPGIMTEAALLLRIPTPFDASGLLPSGRGSQCDPGFYVMFPINQYGVVIPNSSPIGHLFVPRTDPVGAPAGITQPPHSLEIWFVMDRTSFPAPPDGYGYMLQTDTTAGAPTGTTALGTVLTWVRAAAGYTANASTSLVSTTSYYSARPATP